MRRVIRIVSVLIMLVVFPALSWYYLSQGFDYRKEAYTRLLPKEPWNADQFAQIVDHIKLQGKTTVYLTDKISQDFAKRFYDQYKGAYTFQLVSNQVDRANQDLNLVSSSLNHSAYPSAILIDTSAQVRNIYSNDSTSLLALIEDTAIVLPRSPELDIQLPR